MLEENQHLVLKFQELDIGQAVLMEKHSNQVHSIQEKSQSEVIVRYTVIEYLYVSFKNNFCMR